MAQFTLPKIGDGTGGTVTPGNAQLATAGSTELAEILDHFGKKVAQLTPRKRMLFIAVEAERQLWSFSDSPNTFPAADVDPPGGGGGPHATTHQDGGLDEISVTALSGLLADPQAPLSHAHVITDTTGLQTVLDGKADDAHSHVIADVTGLQIALDGKAATSHTHAISDTTGLQVALDGKAAASHAHAQSDVTGLVAALAAKSDVGHTHAASEVVSGVLAAARIATGTPDGTKFLRDDQIWSAPPAGGSPPTGTGFRHVTAGAEDAASKLVDTADINNSQVTLAKIANIATTRILGRVTAAAGIVEELTSAQATALLDAFTSALKGLVPASGGGTTNFLRADGTWASPGGGSDPWTYLKVTGSDFTTTSATAVDVTGLGFTPAANTNYEFYGLLLIRTATATVNPRVGLAWATGGTDGVAMIYEAQTATGAPINASGNINAALLTAVGGLPNTTQSWPVGIEGIFRAGASPTGNVRLQLASETAGTTVRAVIGSFLRYRIIP